MKISKNYNLTRLNTFGITVHAKFFVEINKETDLKELLTSVEFKNNQKLFFGGGSNVLFTKDFDGIVIFNKLKGIEIIENNSDFVLVRSMGGEKWHDLVLFSVNQGFWGLENLSFIPGTVGASPMQNIGAYGAELKDTLENVEAYNIETGEKKVFSNKECEFGYRESIFKNKLKGKYFISAITVKLSRKEKKNINYKVLQEYLTENKIEIKSSRDISDAIVFIRQSKLPNPKVLGNTGSFFKNIFITEEKLEDLQKRYPDIPYFKEDDLIKIPAGWLIEQCGWKGKRVGNVGMHEKQALILVNYGGATGKEIENFSLQVINSVEDKFGLKLEREVNLI